MLSKTYNKTNFHKYTFCIFKEMPFDTIVGLKENYKSKSGSSYYFTDEGVYRLSNHWSRVANCRWRLEGNPKNKNTNKAKVGFALWSDFHQDDDYEKLYFIVFDFKNSSVDYFHKNSNHYKPDFVLRTASETSKIIKQMRNLIETTAWAKYFDKDIDQLRTEIVNELVQSNKTLAEIKRGYL